MSLLSLILSLLLLSSLLSLSLVLSSLLPLLLPSLLLLLLVLSLLLSLLSSLSSSSSSLSSSSPLSSSLSTLSFSLVHVSFWLVHGSFSLVHGSFSLVHGSTCFLTIRSSVLVQAALFFWWCFISNSNYSCSHLFIKIISFCSDNNNWSYFRSFINITNRLFIYLLNINLDTTNVFFNAIKIIFYVFKRVCIF